MVTTTTTTTTIPILVPTTPLPIVHAMGTLPAMVAIRVLFQVAVMHLAHVPVLVIWLMSNQTRLINN